MNIDWRIMVGGLFLFPALSILASWPRRRVAGWLAGAGCLGLWFFGMDQNAGSQRGVWMIAGLASAAACLYAIYVSSRNTLEYDRLDAALTKRQQATRTLENSLSDSKARGKGIETEQREVMALYGLVKGLSEALTWDDIRPTIEIAVQQYLRAEEFSFYVADINAPDRLRPLVRRRLGSSVGSSWETLQRCLQERGLAVNVPNLLQAPESAAALPIFESQKLVGYFYVRIPPEIEAQTFLAKMQTFIDEISFAFRRVILFQEVEQLSQVDGLTGLFRRGMLDEKLKEELVRAQTFRTTFGLMILDIDHFKVLNDTYGHQFGDQVLARVGEILKSGVYETDFVARYGGEEFAVLLPRADPAGVLRKAEALRQAVEAAAFPLAMEQVRVTISGGIAHFPRDGDTVEAVLRQADQALYYAKETGRNRIVDVSMTRRPA